LVGEGKEILKEGESDWSADLQIQTVRFGRISKSSAPACRRFSTN
jgi:hypothetical protein